MINLYASPATPLPLFFCLIVQTNKTTNMATNMTTIMTANTTTNTELGQKETKRPAHGAYGWRGSTWRSLSRHPRACAGDNAGIPPKVQLHQLSGGGQGGLEVVRLPTSNVRCPSNFKSGDVTKAAKLTAVGFPPRGLFGLNKKNGLPGKDTG